eukprot:305858_1
MIVYCTWSIVTNDYSEFGGNNGHKRIYSLQHHFHLVIMHCMAKQLVAFSCIEYIQMYGFEKAFFVFVSLSYLHFELKLLRLKTAIQFVALFVSSYAMFICFVLIFTHSRRYLKLTSVVWLIHLVICHV